MASQTEKLVDRVVDSFLKSVSSGEYVVGKKLPTQDILQKVYGVSRTTMREALKKLETMGIVSIRQGDGTYLNSPDMQADMNRLYPLLKLNETDLDELMEARKILETKTAEMAAARATEEDIRMLQEVLADMERCRNQIDLYTENDSQFHLCIATAAHNSILYRFVKLIYEMMNAQQDEIARIPHLPNIPFAYHADIMESIKEHNSKQAAELMYEHIDNAHQRLKRLKLEDQQ